MDVAYHVNLDERIGFDINCFFWKAERAYEK